MTWLGRLDHFLERNALHITVAFVVVFVAMVALVPNSVYAVGPGEVGVVWSRFGGGTITDRVFGEGTHLKWPWNVHYIYNARSVTDTDEYYALTSDGVQIAAEVSFRYRVIQGQAGMLHKYIGPNFIQVLVRPEVRAAIQTAISQFPTEALYSQRREEIQRLVSDAIQSRERGTEVAGFRVVNMIALHDVLLRRITLPVELQAAIQRKMVQSQVSQEFSFRIERERLEAERKRIEAGGIRDFQQIIGANLTDQYLRWRGIDATLHLAQSPGSRLVIIGGRDGLPVILNPPAGPDRLPPQETSPEARPAPDQGVTASSVQPAQGTASPSTLSSAPLPPSVDAAPVQPPPTLPDAPTAR